jgi:putative tricarboxylic transport membrane protein
MTMGLVMIGAIETNDSAVDLTQVTPIAQLTSEYEAIVVPADSKYKTLEDFAADLKADPSKLAIAGGSAGGTDQILAGLMAKAVGADPKKVNYVAFSGGGEALAAILGGKVAAGISGIGEFSEQVKAGKLRALAVSAPERVASMDAPTMKEAGVDVELANWRGMVAPPDLPADQKQGLIDLVTKMHDSQQWKDALAKNGWDDTFMAGDEFATFLTAEQARVKTIITELGLAK